MKVVSAFNDTEEWEQGLVDLCICVYTYICTYTYIYVSTNETVMHANY
jgi:hypothetical protein